MPAQERMQGFVQPSQVVHDFGIEPGMRVADFGAGSGVYTHQIAKLLEQKGRIYAIDIQKDLLRRISNEAAQYNHSHVDVIWSDLEHEGGSRLADNFLDVVLMSNVLFQLENKKATLLEAKRILKPSGRLIIIDWSDSFGGLGPHPSQVVTPERALQLIQEVGFTTYRTFATGDNHYGLMMPRALQT
jgi:ubiquinone/menaquinone biosynthesis C-methylase UbiE